MKVTPKEFVIAWQSSHSVKECAEKLNLSLQAVYKRCQLLKSHGIKLKPMTSKRNHIDVAELNALIESNGTHANPGPAAGSD